MSFLCSGRVVNRLVCVLALTFLAAGSAQAAVVWDGDLGTAGAQDITGTFTWTAGDLKFWNGSTDVATTNDTTTDIAQFGTGGTLASSPIINVSTQSINGLVFGATTTSGYTLTASSAQVLTIGNSGITVNSGAQATSVGSTNLGLTLAANQAWTNNSASLLTIGGAVNNGGNLLTIGGTGNTALNGVISGVGGLAITGGTVTPGANNTFTGNITVDGSSSVLVYSGGTATTTSRLGLAVAGGANFKTITLSNGGTFQVSTADYNVNVVTSTNLGAGQVFMIGTGGGTFNVDAGRTFTIDDGNTGITGTSTTTGAVANELQGSGALTKTGTGTLLLRSQTEFLGTITIAAGLLKTSGTAGVFGKNSAGTTIQSGAAFDVSGQAVADTEPLAIYGTGLAAVPAGVITNSSGTAGSFAGPITLGATSTIGPAAAGGLTLSGGITGPFSLTISNAAAGGTTVATGAVNIAGTITNSGLGTGTTIFGNNAAGGNLGALVTGVTQNSTTSTLQLNSTTASTFTGPVNIKAGTLNIGGNAAALGNSANIVTLGDTTGTAPAMLNAINTFTYPQPITVAAGSSGTATISTSAGTSTFNGAVTINKPLIITISGSANGTVLTGGITGTGSLTITNAVATGTAGGPITLSGGAVNPIGSITHNGAGLGICTISANIGGNVTDVIQNSTTSLLVLSGTNTYTGQTTVTAGVLDFLNAASMPGYPAPGVGKITVASSGTLGLGYAGAGQFTTANVDSVLAGTFPGITFAATGTSLGLDTTTASASYTGVIGNIVGTTSSGFAKLGANTLTLGTANTYAGPTAIYNGALSVASINSVSGGTSSSSLGAPTTVADGAIILGAVATTGQLTYTGAGETTDRALTLAGTSGGGVIDQSGSGLLRFTGAVTIAASAKTLTLQGAGNGQVDGQISSSTLTLTKAGAGTWTLPATGNAIQLLNMNGGTLDIGAGTLAITPTTAGSNSIQSTTGGTINGTGTITITQNSATDGGNNGTANGTTLTINAKIIGSNCFEAFYTNNGTGVLVLTGQNTYTGNTVLNSGILSVANIGNKLSLTSNLGSGTTISIGTTTTSTGTLRYTGSGETTNRTISFAGTTAGGTIEQAGPSGNLVFSSFATPGAGIKTITLTGSTAGTGEIAAAIVNNSATNTTALTKSGTGRWTLSGVNTYTGNTTISGGTLALAAAGSLANTAITISSGAVFAPAAGAVAGNAISTAAGATLTVNAGSTLNLVDSAVGNFTLNSGATFTGTGLTITGGTLNFDLGNSGADQVLVSGTAKAAASGNPFININTNAATALTPGSYTLISATNVASTLSGATYTLGTPNAVVVVAGTPTAYALSLAPSATGLVLNVALGAPVATPAAYWTGSEDGNWNTVTTATGKVNFTVDALGTMNAFAAPGAVTNVTFTANSTANLTTALNQNFTINSLAFTGTGTGNTAGTTIAAGTGTNMLTINAAALNGNALGNGITVAAGSGANTISANVALGASQTWTNNSVNALTVSGVVSEGGANYGLTKAGAGTLVLSNANTYTGPTTVNGGVVSVAVLANGGTASGIGASPNNFAYLVLNNGTLQYTGGATSTDRSLTIGNATTASGATIDAQGTGPLVITGNVVSANAAAGTQTLTLNANLASGNNTLSGSIANGSTTALTAVTKAGPGAWTLSGLNTYTGATIISTGTLVAAGTFASAPAGNLTIANVAGNAVLTVPSGGTMTGVQLAVGTAAGAAGAVNLTTGGTLTLTSVDGGGNNDSFPAFGAANGAYGALNMSGGTLNEGRFQFGGIKGSNGAGGIGIGLVSGGTVNTAGYMILARDGASTGVLTVTGGVINHANATQNIHIGLDSASTGGRAELNVAGGLIDNTGKAVSFGGTGFNFASGTGVLNINAGTLLTNSIAYSSGTAYLNFNGGTLKAAAAGTLVPTLTLGRNSVNGAFGSYAGGAVIDTNNLAVSIAVPLLAPTGDGVTSLAVSNGGSGYIGAPYVSISGTGAGATAIANMIDDGTGNGTLKVGSITITNPGNNYTGTPTFTFAGGGYAVAATPGAATTAPNTSGGLTKKGLGTLTVTGASTFTGPVTIQGGTLMTNPLPNGGVNSPIGASSNAAANLVLDGGILGYNGTSAASPDRNYTLTTNGGGFDASGTVAGTLTITGNMDAIGTSGVQTFTLSGTGTGATGAATLAGVISDGTGSNVTNLTKSGTGTWTLSNAANSYTGVTTINGGVLAVPVLVNGGVLSSIGKSSSSNANLILNNGTLQYTGGTATTDRNFSFGNATTASGGTIDAQGAGPLTITGSIVNINTAANTQTLTLNANVASGDNTLGGTIWDGSSTALTAVTKTGPGIWTLSGSNAYYGNTTAREGTLNLSGYLSGNGTTSSGSTLAIATAAGNRAVVNVSGSISNYYAINGANTPTSVSVYNQTSGAPTVTLTSTKTDNSTNYVAGNGGYGYFNLTSGTVTNSGRFTVTGSNTNTNGGTTGVVYIGGNATLHSNADWFLIAYNGTNNAGSVTVGPGGTLNHNSTVNPLAIVANSTGLYGALNVTGGTVSVNATKPIVFGNGTGTVNTNGFLNLAAGTLIPGVAMTLNLGSGTGNNAYLNFAGGTIKPNAAIAALIPASVTNYTVTSTIYGLIDNTLATGDDLQDFTGGLVFDTNGYNSSLTNVLNGAAGVGVTQANLSISGGAGYVGAPLVKFSAPAAASGVPAAGYALISGEQVTGIVITAPGTYAPNEVPTVTLQGGGATTAATVTVSALTTANTSGGLTKLSAGTLTLSGISTFAGPVAIYGGTVIAGTLANGGSPSSIGASSSAAANVLLDSGILGYNGTVAAAPDRNYTLTTNGGGFDASGTTAGTLTIGGNIVFSGTGARTLTLTGAGTGATGAGTLTTLVTDQDSSNLTSLTKSGIGTWILPNAANPYSGVTTLLGGTLSVPVLADGGSASSIGFSSSAAANLVLSGGTLQYTGAGATINRNYTFGNATTAAGGGFDAAGTGPLVISGNMTAANTASGTQTLTLTATSDGNALSGTISDGSSSALTGITKTGAGSWTLSGANAYSGLMTISAGTLNITGTNSGATPITFTTGGAGILNINTSGTVAAGAINWAGATAGSLVLNSGTLLVDGNLTSSSSTATALNFAGGTLKTSAPITISGSLPLLFTGNATIDTSGGSITASSGLAYTGSSGSGTFTVQGGNTLRAGLNSSTMGWSGNTVVTGAGTVYENTLATVATGSLTVGTGATYDMMNLSQSFGGLSGGGTVLNTGASAARVLTLTGAGGGDFSGVIAPATSPNYTGLTVTLTGRTQTLSGAVAHTYTGPTTVNRGTLQVTAGSLDNTAITVNASTVASIFAVKPGTGTISLGNAATTAAGASLVLKEGTVANPIAAAFTMADNAIGSVNLVQESSFAGNALTIGGVAATGYVAPSLTFDIGGASLSDIDKLVVSTLASVGTGGGVINFVPLTTAASLTLGDYTFITAAVGSSLGSNLTIGTPVLTVGGTNYQLSLANSTSTAEILSISLLTGNAQSFWKGNLGASWTALSGSDTNFITTVAGTTNTGAIPDFNANVNFAANGATNLSTTLDANFTINSLNFVSGGATIASGTGTNTLTINAAGINGNVAGSGLTATTGVNTVSANVALGASQTWTINAGAEVAVSGGISDGGSSYMLTKTGTGTLTLSGVNTYAGGTVLQAGTININSATALGAGPLTIINGTLDTPLSSQTLTNNNAQTWANGGSLAFTGANALNLGAGAVTFGTDAATGSFTIANNATNPANTLTIGGDVTPGVGGTAGTKTLTITGAGNTILSGSITKGTATGVVVTSTAPGTVTLSGTASTITTLNVNGGATSIVDIGAGTLALNNAGSALIQSTTGGTVNASPGGTIFIGSNGGTTTNLGDFGTAAGTTLTINAPISGTDPNNGFESWCNGAGTVVLAANNTFVGNVVVNQGTLSVAKVGNQGSTTSNLGAGTTIHLNASNYAISVLKYTGTGETSNRVLNLAGSTGAGTIDQSGAGLLKFTVNLTATGAGSKALILTGSTAGTGEIAGIIVDNSSTNTTGVRKSGTGTWTLSGANTYTGATTIDLGTLVFGADQSVGSLVFGVSNGSANVGTLDLSNANGTFTGLTVRTNTASYSTVAVGAGKTLAINGNVTFGYDAGGGTGATLSRLAVAGPGAMSITGTTVNIGTNQAATNAGYWNDSTLDLTGLTGPSGFSANVTTFNIGVGTTTQGPGTVLLSNTANTIIATTLTMGDTGSNNGKGTGTLQLGTGTNVIQADTINIGRGKNTGPGLMQFASQTAGSPGTVTITDKAGTGPANLTVGDNNGTATAGGAIGTLDLRGHVSNVSANTLLLGRNNMGSSTGSVTGTVRFDSGTFTVNNITMAQKSGGGTGAANATLEIGGGNFTVNTGGTFTLGSQATAGTSVATLSLTGGTFTSNADILDGGGSSTSTITLNGGTLDMTGKNIGSASVVINNPNFESGTLKNVATINGTGGLTKTTTGTLILDGTNTWTGNTAVNAGMLLATKPAALPGYNASKVTPVAANAALAVRAGIASDWLGTDIDAALGTTGAAFAANSNFGIEVLAPNSFTYANNLGATVAGKGFVKLGTGTLTLSGANTYTGSTAVNAGTLLVNGSVTGAGNVTVASGATLGGNGTLAGAVAVQTGGFIAPNGLTSDTGTLNLGGTLTINGTAKFELGAAASDKIVVTGAADFNGGTLDVTALTVGGPTFTNGQVFDLFDYASYTNPFTTINLPLLTGGLQWKSFGAQTFDYTNGQIVVESTVVTPAIRTWDGGSSGPGNNLWSTAANWGTSGVPVNNTPKNELVFGGSTRLANNNDIASLSVGKLTFASGAGGFDLQGNALEIAGKIDNQATAAQKVSLDVTFAVGTDSGTLNVVSAGSLELAGAVNSTLGLTKTGLGTAKLSALTGSTYSGPTLVNEGTLEVTKGINLVAATDDTTVGTSTTTATLITEHIRQDTLTINAGSKVVISTTGGSSGTSVVNVLNIANASGLFSWSVPGGDISPAATGGPVASGAAVPEPATWLLAVMAALAGLVAWRRR